MHNPPIISPKKKYLFLNPVNSSRYQLTPIKITAPLTKEKLKDDLKNISKKTHAINQVSSPWRSFKFVYHSSIRPLITRRIELVELHTPPSPFQGPTVQSSTMFTISRLIFIVRGSPEQSHRLPEFVAASFHRVAKTSTRVSSLKGSEGYVYVIAVTTRSSRQ